MEECGGKVYESGAYEAEVSWEDGRQMMGDMEALYILVHPLHELGIGQ